MMGVMEICHNAREVCSYAREKFNRLVTARDIFSLRRKFRLTDDRNDVVHVKDFLRGHDNLWLLKREYLVQIAFFVPDTVRHLVALYSRVLLATPPISLPAVGISCGTLW